MNQIITFSIFEYKVLSSSLTFDKSFRKSHDSPKKVTVRNVTLNYSVEITVELSPFNVYVCHYGYHGFITQATGI